MRKGSKWKLIPALLVGLSAVACAFSLAGYTLAKFESSQQVDQTVGAKRLIYLDISDKWGADSPKFALYVWGNDLLDEFANQAFMTRVGSTTKYYSYIYTGYTHCVFVRIKTESTSPNWDDKWNQTVDLTIPSDKDLFTITAIDGGAGVDHKSTGTWSINS